MASPSSSDALPPFKRTLCKFWREGRCDRGEQCTWLHGEAEEVLIPAQAAAPAQPGGGMPRPWSAAIANGNAFSDRAPEVKKSLCKFFERGICEKGDQCTWAHGPEEIGMPIKTAPPEEELEPPVEDIMERYPAAEALAEGPPSVMKNICKFWLEGKCRNGALCTWAHGEHELGEPAPDFSDPEQRAELSSTLPEFLDEPPARIKRTICRYWQEGNCRDGERCTWAHGEHEIGSPAPPEAPFHHGGPREQQRGRPEEEAPGGGSGSSRKTVCKFWQEGRCRNGDHCTWAHGDGGSGGAHTSGFLEAPASQPSWGGSGYGGHGGGTKRTICKFWLAGFCERGDECTWAHGDDEIGAPLAGGGTRAWGRTGGGAGGPLQPLRVQLPGGGTMGATVVPGTCGAGARPGAVSRGSRGARAEYPHYQEAFPALPGPGPWGGHSGHGGQKHGGGFGGPPQSLKRTACKFWLQGLCERGDLCTWSHGEDGHGSETTVVRRTLCKFWQEGNCSKGPQCSWAHGERELGTLVAAEAPREPCRFFLAGGCQKGNLCAYPHVGAAEDGGPQAKRARLS